MKNLMKIKCIFQSIIIILTIFHSLQAMEDADKGRIENRLTRLLSGAEYQETVQEGIILTFESRKTRQKYSLNWEEGLSLSDYIRLLKREGRLIKGEGFYNYGAQYFFIKSQFTNGNTALPRPLAEELYQEERKIEFTLK